MKKFTLTERASKVIALALTAALIVPAVPGQVSAGAQTGGSAGSSNGTVVVPTPMAHNSLDSAKDYTDVSSTGSGIKFTGEAVETIHQYGTASEKIQLGDVNNDGEVTAVDAQLILQLDVKMIQENQVANPAAADADQDGVIAAVDAQLVLQDDVGQMTLPEIGDDSGVVTYASVDRTPVSADGAYVKEEYHPAPAAVEGYSGSAVKLASSVTRPKYPEGAPEDVTGEVVQTAASYNSAVEIENPFAGNVELYDASRYELNAIAQTATEKQVTTGKDFAGATADPQTAVDSYSGGALTKSYVREADKRDSFTRPDSKKGVTIAFWAKLPVENNAGAATSLLQFYNNSSRVYKADDLAKNYVASLYDEAVEAGTVNATDSPFYIGEVKEGEIVDVHSKVTENFSDINKGQTFKYLDSFGQYVKWNPALADSEAVVTNNGGQQKFFAPADWTGYSTSATAGKKEIVVSTEYETSDGTPIYAHLAWSDTVKAADDKTSNYNMFKSSTEEPMGISTAYKDDAEGFLTLGTTEQTYARDNKTFQNEIGTVSNKNSSQNGKQDNLQTNNLLQLKDETSITDAANDGEWHYFTYSICDSWIQAYVDGVAMDPDALVKEAGNQFNMGSGLYNPNTGVAYAGNDNSKKGRQSDWTKLNSNDWNNSIFGYIFGDSIMKFITDENTKLLIGAKGKFGTVEGTIVDEVSFYDKNLKPSEVELAYKNAAGTINVDPEVVTDASRGAVVKLHEAVQSGDTVYRSATTASLWKNGNPLTASGTALYDPDRYTASKIAKTATEIVVKPSAVTNQSISPGAVANGASGTALSVYYVKEFEAKNTHSRPDSSTGVSLSFWAKIPAVKDTTAGAITNLVQFYNNTSKVYRADDLMKNYIASLYDTLTGEALNATSSPFYMGEVYEGTIMSVGNTVKTTFPDYELTPGAVFAYRDDFGKYVKWNAALAELGTAAGVYKNADEQARFFTPNDNTWTGYDLKSAAKDKEIVVETPYKTKDNKPLYAHLTWSDTVYSADDPSSNYNQYKSTQDAPKGKNTNYTEGGEGFLTLGTQTQIYGRDNSTWQDKKGTDTTGREVNLQGDTNVQFWLKDDSMPEAGWHYFTYSICDSYIQVYVDGKAMDPNNDLLYQAPGKNFNMGSGVYNPNTNAVYKASWGDSYQTDWNKLDRANWTGDTYGYIFGDTIMQFITDPDTKLLIGANGVFDTAEGTLVDDKSITLSYEFLKTSDAQAAYEAAVQALKK